MSYRPKISIITPVFNNEMEIGRCIDSVFGQTYTNIEHIIIDGKSTDNSLSIIKEKAAHFDIIYISEKDEGIYDAMNKGIALASGDYLYFLGSDDVFYANNVLQEIVVKFENNDIIYGNVFFKHAQHIYAGEYNKNRIIDQSICHQAAFFSKRTFKIIGTYDTQLQLAGDWDLFLRCFYHDDINIRYIENIICLYNDLGASGYASENRKTKYRVLYNRLGINGILKYVSIQIKKKLSIPFY